MEGEIVFLTRGKAVKLTVTVRMERALDRLIKVCQTQPYFLSLTNQTLGKHLLFLSRNIFPVDVYKK